MHNSGLWVLLLIVTIVLFFAAFCQRDRRDHCRCDRYCDEDFDECDTPSRKHKKKKCSGDKCRL